MGSQNAYFGAHEYCRILFDYEAIGLRRLERGRCAVYPTCHQIRLTQRIRACSLRWPAGSLTKAGWRQLRVKERPVAEFSELNDGVVTVNTRQSAGFLDRARRLRSRRFLEFSDSRLRVPDDRKAFVRVVASAFDKYLGSNAAKHSVAV